MSAALTKFQELLAISKIMSELHSSVGIKDKTLAEFILSLARKSPTVAHFERELAANEADFEQDLVNTIYAVVTRVFPVSQASKSEALFDQLQAAEEEKQGGGRGQVDDPNDKADSNGSVEDGDDVYDAE